MNPKYAVLCAALAASSLAHSSQIAWDVLTSNSTGSISVAGATPLTVTYSGEMSGWSTTAPNWAAAASSYTGDGTVVANVASGGIELVGGGGAAAQVDTLTFSQAVVNPVVSIWSLGGYNGGNTSASFVFDETPTFVAGGPNAEFGGEAIQVSGNTVSGLEANGTVQFIGTFTSLSWTNPVSENYYMFNVGVAGIAAAVPEPESLALMLAGLGLIGLAARRRAS